jgi:hypothetical protein
MKRAAIALLSESLTRNSRIARHRHCEEAGVALRSRTRADVAIQAVTYSAVWICFVGRECVAGSRFPPPRNDGEAVSLTCPIGGTEPGYDRRRMLRNVDFRLKIIFRGSWPKPQVCCRAAPLQIQAKCSGSRYRGTLDGPAKSKLMLRCSMADRRPGRCKSRMRVEAARQAPFGRYSRLK